MEEITIYVAKGWRAVNRLHKGVLAQPRLLYWARKQQWV